MNSRSILLIDDDPTLLELLAEHLLSNGYHTETAANGELGLVSFTEKKFDMVVLDVMMPSMDGWEVCQRIRAQSSVPIILLTAKGEEVDKLRGFHLGVDDYITKPFSFAELSARIGAVLARAAHYEEEQEIVQSGELRIDFTEHRVFLGENAVDLTPTEYRLITVLASHAHHVIPTEKLLEEVWGQEYAGEVEHVKHYIWSLRKKIENDPGDPKHILTERGFGYRFE